MSENLPYLVEKPKKYLFDGCKFLWHQDRLEAFLRGERVMPITLDIGIHKSCNIKCIYCYGIKQGKKSVQIPEDRLLLLAEDAKKCGIRSIAIIGDGEPTLNKGLYPFVEALYDSYIDCAVATNGLLLDRDKIATLTRCLTWLRFNISAVEKYEYVMGAPRGAFAKFERVVRESVALGKVHGCTIGLQMVLVPEAFSEVIPLAVKAKEWGVDYFVIKQYSDGGTGMPMHFDMNEYDKVQKDLKIAEEMSNEQTRIVVKWSALSDTVGITRDRHWEFDRCIDLPFLFQISGNGECYPCGYLFGDPRYCYGSVVKQRLADILTSQRYWDIVEKVAWTPLKELCTGQCRHCETLKFLDRLNKIYEGDLTKALIEMCGSKEQYLALMDNPPEHVMFL